MGDDSTGSPSADPTNVGQPGEHERKELTAEAIERDRWNAVHLDLPDDISADLALLIRETAYELRNETAAAAFVETDPAEKERLHRLMDAAGERREDAWELYDKAQVREAWQAPEFSQSTIEADPWTAVYLAIPTNADAELLSSARSWATDLEKYAAGNGALAQPFVNGKDYTPDQNIAAAAARIAELDTRLGVMVTPAAEGVAGVDEAYRAPERGASEVLTAAAITENPFNVVHLDIPPDAGRELLSLIATTAGGLALTLIECQYATAEGRPVNLEDVPVNLHDHAKYVPDTLTHNEMGELIRKALARQQDAGERLIAADGPTASDLPLDREPGQSDKARLAEEILAKQGDMHSHYDIGPWQDGFAVFRTYEIDDAMLAQYGLPTAHEVLGHVETLQQLHEAIIDGSALTAHPQWVTDEQMNEAQNSQSRLDGTGQREQQNIDKPTHEREANGVPEAREPVTLEAIERDPWNAIILDLPKDASPELYAAVAETAQNLLDTPDNEWPPAPFSLPRSDEEWTDLGAQIKTRMRDAQHEIWTREPGDDDLALQAMRAEGMNDNQTAAADSAGRDFHFIADADRDDALRDLLCDVMHFAEWKGFEFERELERARAHYAEATMREEAGVTTPEPPTPEPAARQPDPIIMSMTEAIERDPWNAVHLDIPAGASAELLNTIAATAQDLRIHAEERAAAAVSIEETDYWNELGLKADKRFDNAHLQWYEAREREAPQTPESPADSVKTNERLEPFSEQDLYRDPWSAVYQPIPDGAEQTLLELAYIAASRCRASVAGFGSEPGPEVSDPFMPVDLGKDASPGENFDRATTRLAELEVRLEKTQTAGETQAAEAAMAPEQTPQAAVPPERSIGATVSALFAGSEKFVSEIFDYLADMISPSPPPTYAEIMARVADEQNSEQAQQARAADNELYELNEQIRNSEEEPAATSFFSDEPCQAYSRGQRR